MEVRTGVRDLETSGLVQGLAPGAPAGAAAVNRGATGAVRNWLIPAAVFAGTIIPQLALVAAAGTDVPFHDQWNIEGQWLYPAWRDGGLSLAGLLLPFQPRRQHIAIADADDVLIKYLSTAFQSQHDAVTG